MPVPESQPINVADYERLAAEKLEPGVHGYFAGGAGDERTLRENVAAFSRRTLHPRVLVDVSEVSTATTVLGTEISMPLLVAPVAFQRLVDPDGEVAMARAAAGAGTIMCLSTIATSHPAEIAAEAPAAPRWFQLYCFSDRGVTRALIEEAVDSGFEAIALTVDAPRAGRRERDFRTGFVVPPDVTAPAVAAAVGSDRPISVQEVFELVDPTLSWDDLETLASECSLPIVLKGIQTGADAALAVEHGAAGVIVSNHGGRQLDGVPATLDILPEVVEAVSGRCEVLMDGGIRRGTDALTALALGAKAVLAGRAPLWGLAVGGEEGARDVLEILRAEIELGMVLLGCSSTDRVGSEHVRSAPRLV
ncbi:MAG: 4-hydroxymandelate oxidase [Solirubrobacterales bacterium]|jgi:isopentenyl diphosphate isomerase/L-lactate dehydrogenase-like FMN-dependent dehydrogenase|nr:4-hydroxymandelate oxidase [Solirubrobacterales bacterium]